MFDLRIFLNPLKKVFKNHKKLFNFVQSYYGYHLVCLAITIHKKNTLVKLLKGLSCTVLLSFTVYCTL